MKNFPSAIVEVSRGTDKIKHVESRHLIDIVVADSAGNIVRNYGDINRMVFPRSSIKALQALPLVESGAADAFGFEVKHLAMACASHNGEEFHVNETNNMLQMAGLNHTCLECGAHFPERFIDREQLIKSGNLATASHNSCSGKHAGFLAFAAHEKIEIKNYVTFDHEVQKHIARTLAEVTDAKHGDDNFGIDGCSIPTYEIPLANLAKAYAKLSVGEDKGVKRAKAMLRLRDACMAHPKMVAGTGRLDTELMNALKGRVFSKMGAEGVHTLAFPELGFGAALKCHDGTVRAAEVACVALVESILKESPQKLSANEASALKRLKNPVLKNWNKIVVGDIKMAHEL